ncbi:unnamed protein product [Trifolium pratense]|uniref:Uncharacterized protein n=1 Tax=Trifolium pratense TaxID=57577 RepID=A0ACB0IIS0_TRIPR|nr:unnamed protein product [Trifolium pratense]
MGSKWEIEKFTGKNDFGLWKVKVRAILTQQKCVEALLGISNMPNTLSNAEKSEMNDKALSVIILCLADNVLREVAKEKTAAAMWTKLDALYMTKSLAHKQCLKERLFFFRMVENKPVVEQLSEFNKIIDDLANIDVNLEDEDKAFHLLCALPKSLENLKDALLYGKEGGNLKQNKGGSLFCRPRRKSWCFRRKFPPQAEKAAPRAEITAGYLKGHVFCFLRGSFEGFFHQNGG